MPIRDVSVRVSGGGRAYVRCRFGCLGFGGSFGRGAGGMVTASGTVTKRNCNPPAPGWLGRAGKSIPISGTIPKHGAVAEMRTSIEIGKNRFMASDTPLAGFMFPQLPGSTSPGSSCRPGAHRYLPPNLRVPSDLPQWTAPVPLRWSASPAGPGKSSESASGHAAPYPAH